MQLSSRKSPVGRLSGFDYFVLLGAAVNLLVVGYLIGIWLAAG